MWEKRENTKEIAFLFDTESYSRDTAWYNASAFDCEIEAPPTNAE